MAKYTGEGNPDKPPVKVGDTVVNVNMMNPKKLKVLDIAYGSPKNLKADEKISDEDIKALFGNGGNEFWWIVVNGKGAWTFERVGGKEGEKDETKTIAVPYGEDGFMKPEDVKEDVMKNKDSYATEAKETFASWIKKNTPRLREEYREYLKDMQEVKEKPMSFEQWAKESFENMGAMTEEKIDEKVTSELQDVIKIVGSKEKIMEILDDPDNLDEYYEKLFDYYTGGALGPDQMPYGTAKARTGDPYEWIYKRLDMITSPDMKESFAVDTPEKASKIADKIGDLDAKYQRIYRDMPEHEKELFNMLVGAIKNPMKEESITEAKSLLKDTPSEPETSASPEKKPTMDEATFTKQHYIAIANILKSAKDKDSIVNQLVDFFKKDNPLFDKTKFIQYVGASVKEESSN